MIEFEYRGFKIRYEDHKFYIWYDNISKWLHILIEYDFPDNSEFIKTYKNTLRKVKLEKILKD